MLDVPHGVTVMCMSACHMRPSQIYSICTQTKKPWQNNYVKNKHKKHHLDDFFHSVAPWRHTCAPSQTHTIATAQTTTPRTMNLSNISNKEQYPQTCTGKTRPDVACCLCFHTLFLSCRRCLHETMDTEVHTQIAWQVRVKNTASG